MKKIYHKLIFIQLPNTVINMWHFTQYSSTDGVQNHENTHSKPK